MSRLGVGLIDADSKIGHMTASADLLFSVRCAFAVDSSRRGHLHTAQVLPRQLHGHFLRAPRRDRTCGHLYPTEVSCPLVIPSRTPRAHALTLTTHTATHTREDHATCSWYMRPSFPQRQLVHTA